MRGARGPLTTGHYRARAQRHIAAAAVPLRRSALVAPAPAETPLLEALGFERPTTLARAGLRVDFQSVASLLPAAEQLLAQGHEMRYLNPLRRRWRWGLVLCRWSIRRGGSSRRRRGHCGRRDRRACRRCDDRQCACFAAPSPSPGVRKSPQRVIYRHPAPWTPAWYNWCMDVHPGFDPHSGYFPARDGTYRFCH